MRSRWSSYAMLAFIAISACVFSDDSQAQEVKQEFMASGATRIQGGYRPIRANMDQEEDILDKLPEDLENPKFGYLTKGDQKWAFVIDENEDGEQTLYVDTNGDRDLTNDPKAQWKPNTRGNLTQYLGSAKVQISEDQLGAVNMYRFDPNDKRRATLKNTMLYYFDFGTTVTLTLDGKEFSTGVAGVVADGDTLRIDRDGNGKMSRSFETLKVGQPFNFTGTTYVLNSAKGELSLSEAEKELPVAPMPPDLRVGKEALTFAAETMAGDKIEFPRSYKGKIVMLDFWATWCGPCIGEIPNMKAAYAKWHDHGFEILGISFDSASMEEKIQAFREKREMPWPQIYEGKRWETKIGRQHDVSGIPFVLVVDGDTGEILGTSAEARGPKLTTFIGKMLNKKGLVSDEELEAVMNQKDGDDSDE